jgi:ribonucleoside-diphosphate reductase beta chain
MRYVDIWLQLEDKFLDLVFDMGDIQGLTKKDMYAYNRYIADRRLLQLGLKTNYDQRENPLGWIDEVTGVEHQNFFEGTSYYLYEGRTKWQTRQY